MGNHSIATALYEMAIEVRELNIEKGWRAGDGSPASGQTFGDYIALAHSELSEALDAYRRWKLEDATEPEALIGDVLPKPEGVGSELADTLIRLIDMADIFGIDLAAEYHRKMAFNRTRSFRHGGKTL